MRLVGLNESMELGAVTFWKQLISGRRWCGLLRKWTAMWQSLMDVGVELTMTEGGRRRLSWLLDDQDVVFWGCSTEEEEEEGEEE